MLWSASAIKGYAIAASDGPIGAISDVLFDDASWRVRWIVIDIGDWLSDHKVLLPPRALGRWDAVRNAFPVDLKMQEVEDQPRADVDRSVSRQMRMGDRAEHNLKPHLGNGYMGAYLSGMGGTLLPARPLSDTEEREREIIEFRRDRGDPHLRSAKAVTGYHVHATDGEIGHVEDLLVDDAHWNIEYLVVNTSNWWIGKKVLISPRSAREINWWTNSVQLDVDRNRVKASRDYEGPIMVAQAYEGRLENVHVLRLDSDVGSN